MRNFLDEVLLPSYEDSFVQVHDQAPQEKSAVLRQAASFQLLFHVFRMVFDLVLHLLPYPGLDRRRNSEILGRKREDSCKNIDNFLCQGVHLGQSEGQHRDEQIKGFFYHLHRDENDRLVVRVQQLEEHLNSILDAVRQGSTETLPHLTLTLKGQLEVRSRRRRHRQSNGRVPVPR